MRLQSYWLDWLLKNMHSINTLGLDWEEFWEVLQSEVCLILVEYVILGALYFVLQSPTLKYYYLLLLGGNRKVRIAQTWI